MTLRDRLIALAGVMNDGGHSEAFDRECLALAAARMALEDAEQAADAVAASEACVSDRTGYVADECKIMIRALRDGLEP